MARDLHDAVSQTLFSASLIADVLPKLWKRDPETGDAVHVESMVDLDLQRAETKRFPLYHKIEGRSCHLNIGTLKAGDWVSTVAGFAEMACRISFIPGESMAETKQTVEQVIEDVARADKWLRDHLPEVEWFGWHTEPWYQDPADSFIKTVLPCLEAANRLRQNRQRDRMNRLPEYCSMPRHRSNSLIHRSSHSSARSNASAGLSPYRHR